MYQYAIDILRWCTVMHCLHICVYVQEAMQWTSLPWKLATHIATSYAVLVRSDNNTLCTLVDGGRVKVYPLPAAPHYSEPTANIVLQPTQR